MELASTLAAKLASSLTHFVTQRLASVVAGEIVQVWKVDDKLRELHATYLEVGALLGNLECWQLTNPTLELWLQDLERYCYDTEDLIDDLILRCSSKEEDEKPSEKPVRGHVFKSGRFTVPHKIGELQKKLHLLGVQLQSLLSAVAICSANPQTRVAVAHCGKNLLSDKTPLVSGTSRDLDKQFIVLELTSPRRNSCGVSIIGMDGLGKTSLARSILDDDNIRDHFPTILSAHVSGQFQIRDTVEKLVADHSRRTLCDHHQTIELDQKDRILQNLCSSTSLIVLDDLWGLTDEEWEYFIHNFLNLNSGSRILATTRNPQVAEVTGSTSFYLKKMTDDDCKSVVLNRAKLSKLESERWAEDIEVIAKKCQGMPIVASKLGLKLSKKKSDERMVTVIEFKMKELRELQEFREIFPSLNLDEPMFPPDIKRCFAYCSLFPCSHEFSKNDLTQLWEVEGFIQHQQTRSSKQAIKECFDYLLSRSILQPFKSRVNRQTVYKMHEFNHEFAQSLASKAFRRVGEGTCNLLSSCQSIRHLSLTRENVDDMLLKKIEQCKGLRTFLLLHQDKPHTRTISYHCLQILKLKDCSSLLQLPKDLNQLISLTHLYVNMKSLVCVPLNMGKLIKLEVLDSFDVGKGKGCKAVELGNMKELVEIHISGLENICNREEARGAMLSEKLLLRTLVLDWDSTSVVEVKNAEEVLQGLEPHIHLQNLVLRNYPGKQFPTWLVSASCQLVSIHLENFQNCEVLPPLGQLPLLKNLVLSSISNVKILDSQSCGLDEGLFPGLESLEFRAMETLARWTGLKAGDMPNLRMLKVVDSPCLVNLPSFEHLSCLKKLEINNCPELPSLPELPSMNGVFEELIIIDSDLVTERCQTGGADWRKIKDIRFVEIDAIRVLTESSLQHIEDIKGKVQSKEPQHQTISELLRENNVPQEQLKKVPTGEQYCSRCLRLRDEIHTSRDHGTTSDEPTSSQRQPATVNQMDEEQINKGSAVLSMSKNSQEELRERHNPEIKQEIQIPQRKRKLWEAGSSSKLSKPML